MIAQVESQANDVAVAGGPRFYVTYRGVAVRFSRNLCGPVYSMCHVDEATVFGRRADAWQAITDYRMPALYCEVVESGKSPIANSQ